LAELYRQQGRYAEAEVFYQRSLSILEGVFGLEHPNIVMTREKLAELYDFIGRQAEAQKLRA
jgi:hypothetical protein